MIPTREEKRLPPPYEIFEFVPCQPAFFKIVSWELGWITIKPRFPGAPPSKDVLALRLHVDPATKPYFPHYWDITSSRLVHQLAGMLTQGVPENMYLRVHRDIPGPKAHFSVGWVATPG